MRTNNVSRCAAVFVGVAFTLAMVGCALSPVPDTRTANDYARKLDAKCRDKPDDQDIQTLSPESIESVDAAYVYVMGGPNGRSARLRGARIELKPLAGASGETLTRAFECHEANVVLGRTTSKADDPYVLDGRWLDIEVRSEKDSFAAFVTTDDFNDAQEVLARAKRYARQKQ
jgi:hypothetical protein